jgi:hypothetical protein
LTARALDMLTCAEAVWEPAGGGTCMIMIPMLPAIPPFTNGLHSRHAAGGSSGIATAHSGPHSL